MIRHIVLSLLAGCSLAVAATDFAADFKPMRIPVEKGDRLVIEGSHVGVRLKAAAPGETNVIVRITPTYPKLSGPVPAWMEAWSFTVKRDGDAILLQEQSPIGKGEWGQVLNPALRPQFQLEISSPSMPLVLTSQKGDVDVTNWESEAKVSLGDGNIKLNNGKGAVRVSGQQSRLTVQNHEGPVRVEIYQGHVNLKNIKGDVTVESYTAQTEAADITGAVEIVTFDNTQTWQNVDGRMKIQSQRAKLNIKNLEGGLSGQVKKGSLNASLSGPVQVQLQSQDADVDLKVSNSAAAVNVGTIHGQLRTPAGFEFEQIGDTRIKTGRLKGEQPGRIFIRSDSGLVSIR